MAVSAEDYVTVERARRRDPPLFWAGPTRVARCRPASSFAEGTPTPFRACLDTIEDKTGLTLRQFIGLVKEESFDDGPVKAGAILDWVKTDHGLGCGYGRELVYTIKKGLQIDAKIRRLRRHALRHALARRKGE
ncbi:DUF4287 domain-containing protein [Brevibacterium permense]|uniref:DUF4287 domain-containing protein n=1 Tax=Brevibacterium permense TaxID=234834 RepID=UPI003207A1C0